MIPFEKTPYAGGERETLRAFLQQNRSIVLWKLDGITLEQGAQKTVESDTTLLGVLKHLAWVERWWFCDFIDGQEVEYPWGEEDPDGEWRINEGDTVDSIRELYATAVDEANTVIDAAESLDVMGSSGGRSRSLRWVMVHMIEETARHAGHLDIIREIIDGTAGYTPE
ncbi:MAG: DinB family protein [Acidimicrobiia bacterium]